MKRPPAFLHTLPHHCEGIRCMVAMSIVGFKLPNYHPQSLIGGAPDAVRVRHWDLVICPTGHRRSSPQGPLV